MSATVSIYTTPWCPYCARAKALLTTKNVRFNEVDVDARPELRDWLVKTSSQHTVPQVFINNRPVGGFSDIAALDRRGELDKLLAEDPPQGLAALPQ